MGWGMLWGPSPAWGSRLQAGVHQEHLGFCEALTYMYMYMCVPYTYAFLSASGPAHGGSLFWGVQMLLGG